MKPAEVARALMESILQTHARLIARFVMRPEAIARLQPANDNGRPAI